MKPFLLALALNSAEAAEPTASCAPAQHEVRDQSCVTQADLSRKLKAVFPGKDASITDLGDKAQGNNRFLIDLNGLPTITVRFSGSGGDTSCQYASQDEGIWYPSLEHWMNKKVPEFKPETEVVDVSTIQEVLVLLTFPGRDSIDFSDKRDPFVANYDQFGDMVEELKLIFNRGHLMGFSSLGIQERIDAVRSKSKGNLSKENIKRTVIDSDNFKKLSPEIQRVFSDYAGNEGPIVWALSQMPEC